MVKLMNFNDHSLSNQSNFRMQQMEMASRRSSQRFHQRWQTQLVVATFERRRLKWVHGNGVRISVGGR